MNGKKISEEKKRLRLFTIIVKVAEINTANFFK